MITKNIYFFILQSVVGYLILYKTQTKAPGHSQLICVKQTQWIMVEDLMLYHSTV